MDTTEALAPGPGFKQLEVKAKCVYEDETLLSHIKLAMQRPIAHFDPSPINDHEVALIGSAPSIANHVEEIRALKERGVYVMAIKAAHDFLISYGVIPDAAVMVDPQPHIIKCFQKKRDDIIYFIASQCNPEVFDYFKDSKVVLWHLLTKKEGEDEAIKGDIAIGGGSTSGMRAMTLAWSMGFRKMHLFAYDSSLTGDLLKIDGTCTSKDKHIRLWIHGREFDTNAPMAAQTTEFEKVMSAFRNQVQVRVYGDGAIPWLAKCRYEKGETDITFDEFRPMSPHVDYWKV